MSSPHGTWQLEALHYIRHFTESEHCHSQFTDEDWSLRGGTSCAVAMRDPAFSMGWPDNPPLFTLCCSGERPLEGGMVGQGEGESMRQGKRAC